ncbi:MULTISPECIES: SDR family NAD(P)-dependent oxidoreductase [Cryobacterium]|uniref:SDR family NAD(P)-dependent oxidoreductase n=1 Tax=Cryobacterium TaxID=69578 RepID=UPI001F543782|nr:MULTISPECIES: SDR family NAD(P)-dependent oxidoreductase [Cryobacterium]
MSLDIRRLDVTEPDSATQVVTDLTERYGRLDALINNAGSGRVGTIENETVDDVRAVMEANFFGVVAVTRAALPHLRKTRRRLISVSSVGGVVGQPFNEAYCAAKFAVEGFHGEPRPRGCHGRGLRDGRRARCRGVVVHRQRGWRARLVRPG